LTLDVHFRTYVRIAPGDT